VVVDALSNLLRGVRADGVILSGLTPSPPWELRVGSGAALTLCSPLRGDGWLVLPGDAAPTRLRTGDTAVVRGPLAFSFVDAVDGDPARPCTAVCRDNTTVGALCAAEDAPADAAALLVAKFPVQGEVGNRLLEALPPVLVVLADPACEDILDYIAGELVADRPGQQVVLERLLDWILVCTLRAWFDSAENAAPAWYLAMADPVVGAALRAIHDDHAHPWTVATLARATGVSRAAFAKRFTDLVGEPPLTYLTGWRMTVAADLLAEPGATVAGVARRVGYADPFGFSAAFKRTRGTSPSEFRRRLDTRRDLARG
jgi:AraC-like DNA-binding protein